jgi:phosphoribosylamine-glycine ligase
LFFLETLQPPFVLKADGLAAGKGVDYSDLAEARRIKHVSRAKIWCSQLKR